jgi:hypothetical protein
MFNYNPQKNTSVGFTLDSTMNLQLVVESLWLKDFMAVELVAILKNAGMLRLFSEILPRIKSAKKCDVTVEICIS